MRYFLLAAVFAAALSGASQVKQSPFLRVDRNSSHGEVHLTAINVSQHPIVAYVVIANSGYHRVVWHGVYTDGDSLGVNSDVKLGNIREDAPAETTKITVDYVRLADGEAWGKASTEEAKRIAARFQNGAPVRPN